MTVGFVACSSDDNEIVSGGQEPEPPLLPLTIEVAEHPLVNPDEAPSDSPQGGEKAPKTRAAITTTSTLSAFDINYVYGELRYTNGSPITATKSAEGKWTSAANQKDLLVAKTSAKYTDHDGNVRNPRCASSFSTAQP